MVPVGYQSLVWKKPHGCGIGKGIPLEENVLCAAVRCSSRAGAGGENFVLTNARNSGGMTSGGRKAGSEAGWLYVRIVGNGLLR